MRVRWSLDGLRPHRISGWALHPDAPDRHVEVTVFLDAIAIGRQVAAKFRPDLKRAGLGGGDHAFDIFLTSLVGAADLPRLSVIATGVDGERHDMIVDASKWITDASDPAPGPMTHETVVRNNFDVRRVKKFLRLGSAYSLSSPLDAPLDRACDLAFPENPETARLEAALRRDTWAIPRPSNRENYSPNSDFEYWASGFRTYENLRAIAAENGTGGGRCLDFGGSSGRVARHFAIQEEGWDVWLADFKESSVEFVNNYLPPDIKAFANSAFPNLPLPDSYFDFVFACSVFTHINETELPWLLELRRILRVGGLACLSIHDDVTWQTLHGSREPAFMDFLSDWAPELVDVAELPSGQRLVVANNDVDPYGCNVYHSADYIHRLWGRFFEIIDIRPRSLGVQAVVVCRRKD
jgi:SAM-dependent methyltransferase